MSTDNRPLVDLATNIEQLNSSIGDIGFYQELKANPETEPVGGFSLFTCASVEENGLLYPINISLPIFVKDYSKYAIYLITDKVFLNNSYVYKCLSFSATYVLSKIFNKFLSESIGRTLKVGPSGELVDEIFFDLYFSDKNYQNLSVGKVLTPNTITFGGNQVAANVSLNSFLGKNKNDFTKGLVTILRSNEDSNIVAQGILSNMIENPYTLVEYQNFLAGSTSNSGSPIDVYFTNTSLTLDSFGKFISDSGISNYLNQVHFKSPTVSANNDDLDKYGTSGVNVSSLIAFSNQNVLHTGSYSTVLNELSQSVSTSLVFTPTDHITDIKFTETPGILGTTLDTQLYPNLLFTTVTDKKSGISFSNTSQLSICGVKDITTGSVVDTNTLGPKITEFKGSTSLVISAKKLLSTDIAANLVLNADGYVILSSNKGVYYSSPNYDSGEDTEILTKGYVTNQINSLRTEGIQNRIPLTGTEAGKPVTGSIEFDTTKNTLPNTVFVVKTISDAQIQSYFPIIFANAVSPQTTMQTVRARTPLGTVGDPGTSDDLVNRGYLESVLAGADSTLVKVEGPQNITGIKTFTKSPVISDATTPALKLLTTNSGTGLHGDIQTNGEFVSISTLDETGAVIGLSKARVATPSSTDPITSVATVEYVSTALSAVTDTSVWASWDQVDASDNGSLLASATPTSASAAFSNVLSSYSENNITYYKNTSSKTLHIKVSATVTLDGINTTKLFFLHKVVGGTPETIVKNMLGGFGGQGYYLDDVAHPDQWNILGNFRQYYTKWIGRYAYGRASSTIDHIITIAPGEGFNFTVSGASDTQTATSTTTVEAFFKVYGSLQVIGTN